MEVSGISVSDPQTLIRLCYIVLIYLASFLGTKIEVDNPATKEFIELQRFLILSFVDEFHWIERNQIPEK